MAGNGKNGTKNGVIERRRKIIAAALLRRPSITRRELQSYLATKGIINPETLKPFSLGTIQNDIDALKGDWQERSDGDFDGWMSEQIAALDQLQGDAWTERDYSIVLRCLQERAKLKGLYAAAKQHNLNLDMSALTTEQLERIAAGEDPAHVIATTKSEG